ncbi:hypothetical protein [Jannaschia rubra]|uniref:Uncharacterized protein n=1 Tax=Jannaschia rubra TaxID=282197 RepID=A0A0M6XN27_9RHOB|nr:hypothetical protein [Jannaschia rubra]CTQ32072.1 hypothetical protein JAN5088_00834 [Jannaschia rubra]SFG38229.1 hypothetical protein SAMN04488517_104160 [Jannaschia rubra]
MAALIWIGAAMTVAGLLGLGWCIFVALRARRQGLEGAAMEARLRGLVAVNLGALALSAIGLMLVAAGVILG